MSDKTLVWVSYCLGLHPAKTPTPSNVLIRNFASVGEYLQEKNESCKGNDILSLRKEVVSLEPLRPELNVI